MATIWAALGSRWALSVMLSSDWSLTPAGCLSLVMDMDGNYPVKRLLVGGLLMVELSSDWSLFISGHGHGWQLSSKKALVELSSDWSLTPAGCLFLDVHIDGNNLESCLEVSIVCDVVCRLKSDTIRMLWSQSCTWMNEWMTIYIERIKKNPHQNFVCSQRQIHTALSQAKNYQRTRIQLRYKQPRFCSVWSNNTSWKRRPKKKGEKKNKSIVN